MRNIFVVFALFSLVLISLSFLFGRQSQQGYILEHEQDLAKDQPPPHNGTGMSTAYSFFTKAPDLKLTFRKRVLKKGAAIGYHPQKDDEIYYVVSGTGMMRMNNDSFSVKSGDGVLTRPGNTHGLRQTGNEDLVIIINYLTK
jgi:mannose-6-phosphate isomerase-like protein (cupin superfamily)